MKIFIFTAGFGKRFKPFTNNIAKPALPFLGLPILSFPLYYMSKIKNSSWIFNLHHNPKSIQRALLFLKQKKKSLKRKKITFSYENPMPLGSSGGLFKAKSLLLSSKHFLTLNGDSLFFLTKKNILQKMIQKHIETKALATLLCTPFSTCVGLKKNSQNKSFKKRGIRIEKQTKNILGFESYLSKKVPSSRGSEVFHFTGVQIFSRQIFDFIPKGSSHIFQDILSPLLGSKHSSPKVKAFTEKNIFWFETGNLESYKKALETCLNSLYKKEFKRKKEKISNLKLKKALNLILKDYSQEDLKNLNLKDLRNFNLKQEIENSSWL